MPKKLHAPLATMVVALASREAVGAPCCGDQSGLGARLGRDEALSIVGSVAFAERLGGYDGKGAYAALPAGSAERHFRFEQAITVRVTPRLEIGARVPESLGQRTLDGRDEVGGGVGDPAAFARATIVPVDDTTFAPALFAAVTVDVPLGRPPWLGQPLSSDVTGQGAGEVSLTLASDKTWAGRWFASVATGVGFFTSVEHDGARTTRSPRLTLDAATGPVFDIGGPRTLVFGVALSVDAEDAPTTSTSTPLPGRRRIAVGAPLAIDLTARWALLGDIRVDVPVDRAGQADVAELRSTVGVRFGARAWDL